LKKLHDLEQKQKQREVQKQIEQERLKRMSLEEKEIKNK